MIRSFLQFARGLGHERGQTFVEYATLIGFVSIALLGAYALLTLDLSGVASALESVIP